MARRKTLTVKKIVEKGNHFLRVHNQVGPEGRAARKAVASFIETILHDSGNYRGFRYLNAHEMENGLPCGIILDSTGNHNHTYPDDSRVAYTPPRD